MASHKEEPNPSILFGDSAGDDPFSQIQQQGSEAPAVTKRNSTTTTAHEQPVADASSLFGGNAGGNADLFFSQPPHTTAQQQPPLTSNASAASFFEQPALSQNPSESFFDGLDASSQQAQSHQQQPAAAASLTQAYDPNTYLGYDYTQQQQQQPEQADIYSQQQQGGEVQQQQQYDQSQWIQFDPNQHYYYDEQGQVHYYDPNTNQEYDMNQYGYDQQGGEQTYDYQYDPQYAEYYAQQGYDANAYAATPAAEANSGGDIIPEQAYAQQQEDNYDPNAYAPQQQQQNVTATTAPAVDQGHYNADEYNAQGGEQQSHDYQVCAPSNDNAVAEVPAQIQSEQTTDTQHYHQQDGAAQIQYQQQQDYNYQGYEGAEDLQQQHGYAQNYSQIQTEFAEDLQRQPQAPPAQSTFAPPPKASAGPPLKASAGPPLKASAAPPRAKSVGSLPPQQQQQAIPPPPKNMTTSPPPQQQPQSVVDDLLGKQASFQNETLWLNSEPEEAAASAPPLSQQPSLVPTLSQRGSYDANVPVVQESQSAVEEGLDDLDDLVLGGGPVKDSKPADEFDLLMSTADYDAHIKEDTAAEKEHVYANLNQYEEKPKEEEAPIAIDQFEQQVPAAEEEHKQEETTKPVETFTSYEPQQPAEETFAAYEPQQQEEQQPIESSYESQQQYGVYDPQQYGQQERPAESYEPYQGEQAVDYSSYASQKGEQSVDYSSYEPQQGEQAVDYSSYEPQQSEQAVDYSPYEPQQASYEPQQQQAPASYEPQQAATSYEPQQQQTPVSYGPQQQQAAASYALPPQQKQEESYFNNYAPQQQQQQAPVPPPAAAAPVIAQEPSRQFVASPPPPSRRNMISPPPHHMQSFSQRSNSITESDRRQNGSPFAGYYNNNAYSIERSATVPPPITERIASPRPALIACPDPQCEGENKAKAKFCCECGRPLAGISRSTTPSASLSLGGFSMNEAFSPISSSFAPPPQRTALDDKKDAMIESLKTFNSSSVLVNSDSQDKQKIALDYIESRVGGFEPSKALLWNIVKLMIQYQDSSVLGDGGELDKSIVTLLSSQSTLAEPTSSLDRLEVFLAQGDREGACQFAIENDMWAHALIISQSHNTDHFKHVISQFIDRELFSSSTQLIPQIPGDKKSLRMLYSVFNGAGAEAVVELARNSIDDHPTSYSKESLEGWKNALSFILANRSSKDKEAITGLGDQLKQVGSIHDAYICYILSPDIFAQKSAGLEAQIILGVEGSDIYTDLDALYLTELYEFALSTSKTCNVQNYKLIHAWWLSELGFSSESEIYCDSIVNTISTDTDSSVILQGLKQIGENISTASSDHVTSLLNKTTFDTLIGSIEAKVGSSQNNYGYQEGAANSSYGYVVPQDDLTIGYVPTPAYSGGQEAPATAADTLQPGDSYNFGYGYGGSNSYTEPADSTTEASPYGGQPAAIKSPFVQANKGIQSPFQKSPASAIKPVQSPFGVAPAAAGVRSPFQHTGGYAQRAATESGWWGSEEQTGTDELQQQQQTNEYQPYQPTAETPAANTTSYQPNSYAPPAAATTNSGAWDDDDDLGFGNTNKSPAKEEEKDEKKAETAKEEKPNEKEDTKEEKAAGGGWGLFSLWGRKKEDQNLDEKKAVKANLGEQSSFYYDEVEKRWKNKGGDLTPAATATPPPPKATTPKPPLTSPARPTMESPMAAPPAGKKPASVPPTRISSTPNVPSSTAGGGPPNAATPSFNTPPPSSRKGAGPGARKPMRSRYVDVLNTNS